MSNFFIDTSSFWKTSVWRMVFPCLKSLLLFTLLFPAHSIGQKDSLVKILEKKLGAATTDSARIVIYADLSDACDESEILNYCGKGLKICEQKLKGANAAQKKFLLSQKMIFINNSGYYYHLNDPIKALECYYQATELATTLGDSNSLATGLMNIGQIHFVQGNLEKALSLFEKCYKIKINSGDKEGLADVFLNLGNVYRSRGKIDSAIYFTEKSLALRKDIKDTWGVCNSLVNLGNLYSENGKPEIAKDKFTEACAAERDFGDTKVKAHCLVSMGKVYMQLKNYPLSLVFLDSAISIGSQFNYMEILQFAFLYKYKTLKLSGKTGEALKSYEQYIFFNDSLQNQLEGKEIFRKEEKHEYEKKTAADSVRNAEQQKVVGAQLAAQTASLKQEQFQRYSLIVGLLIVLAGLAFVINRFRLTQKQNILLAEKTKTIEEQKIVADMAYDKLQEKNKEVMDSIHYANRIQRVLFPTEKYIERSLRKTRENKS
ncbi:MAG: tetratricopeptide repeat protein [Bacteroidia bacterium]|nr:tetratricopeptide repeat protein [Bacteroidia bacterium]